MKFITVSQPSPPGGPREEPPLLQTKAKLNHTLSGGTVSDFGMDSMFESSRYVYPSWTRVG